MRTHATILLLTLAMCAAPAAAGGTWFSADWQFRREINTASYQPTGLGGDDVGCASFFTGGQIKLDAQDIRVVTPDGKELPCRVLMAGPGDQASVAFAMYGSLTKYYVYFGNSKAGAPKPLDIRRGVLLESSSNDRDVPVRTVAEARQVLAASKVFIGRQFRDRIFLGFNPFGPQEKLASVFTGWFVAKAGKHVFATSSRDASFLLVDDRSVVDNGGFHQPQENVAKQGSVDLTAGLHKLTFYHVSSKGNPIAVVAWQPPGEDRIVPVPAKAFAPVSRFSPGPLEQYGRDLTVDATIRFAGEAFHRQRYYERYAFEALPAKGVSKWEWDFGDGQTSAQAKTEHVYLLPGEYTVTLTGQTPGGPQKCVNKLAVARPWEQVTENKLDPLKLHADIVAQYDFSRLTAPAAVEAVLALERAETPDVIARAGKAMLAHPQAPGAPLAEAAPVYAQALRRLKQTAQAVDAYVQASKMTTNPAVCAELLVDGGQFALELGSKDDLRKAQELFELTVKKYELMTTAPPIRQAKIGIGDVWRARGDYENAHKAYDAARVGPEGASGKPAIVKGDFARHVEDYVRKGELQAADDYLDRWQDTYPLDKLEGYWSLLYVKAAMEHKQWYPAIREAETLALVNPTSNYAAELLMLSADCYQELRRYDKAAAALAKVAEEYRESPLAAQAAKRLPTLAASAPASKPAAGAASKPAPAKAP